MKTIISDTTAARFLASNQAKDVIIPFQTGREVITSNGSEKVGRKAMFVVTLEELLRYGPIFGLVFLGVGLVVVIFGVLLIPILVPAMVLAMLVLRIGRGFFESGFFGWILEGIFIFMFLIAMAVAAGIYTWKFLGPWLLDL